jgi:uncharacterized protein (DUF1330 family)
MAAYAIVDVRVTDVAGFAEYGKRVPATLAAFGGRVIARGGDMEVLEGAWKPNRLVILEFPSLATLKAWYQSPEYQHLLEGRKRAADTNLVIVDGI